MGAIAEWPRGRSSPRPRTTDPRRPSTHKHDPDDHFVIDPEKWHFYEMDAYRNMGQDALAQIYAKEVLRLGTSEFGIERSPMRNAEARLTLGVIAARAGDVDEAVSQGIRALAGGRQSIPSSAMVAQELMHELQAPQFFGNARH